jgi:CDP-glucose 4,6-dehydratase
MESLFSGTFKGVKVLVTGDTGFKGSWLSLWLLEMGAEVFGYSLPPVNDHDNFVTTGLSGKIVHHDGDVTDLDTFHRFVERVKPEIVFHLAAQSLVLRSYKDPVETYKTNILGTVNVLEIVRRCSFIKAAIMVTSDKCYENQNWIWGYRENDPMGGSDPYSSSKGCAELITSAYNRSYFMNNHSAAVASARAGNVIGGGDWADDRIVPDFFRAIREGKDLIVRNPGFTRPWQHVLEPLSGYLDLAAHLINNKSEFSGGWNFGPPGSEHHSVKDLITLIIKLFGKGGYSCPDLSGKLHEARLLKLDVSKSANLLGWHPALDFSQTVSFTVEGYRSDLSGSGVYQHRLHQIKDYVRIAREKKITWAL